MSSLILEDTKEIPISTDSLVREPDDESTMTESVRGEMREHTMYTKDVFTFQTTPLSKSEVTDIEDFLISYDNIMDCSGICEGKCDVTVEDSEFRFFYKNGTANPAGQILSIRVEKFEGGGD